MHVYLLVCQCVCVCVYVSVCLRVHEGRLKSIAPRKTDVSTAAVSGLHRNNK